MSIVRKLHVIFLALPNLVFIKLVCLNTKNQTRYTLHYSPTFLARPSKKSFKRSFASGAS
jgi:hypothetical protein